jgi:hypothetical protein
VTHANGTNEIPTGEFCKSSASLLNKMVCVISSDKMRVLRKKTFNSKNDIYMIFRILVSRGGTIVYSSALNICIRLADRIDSSMLAVEQRHSTVGSCSDIRRVVVT